MTVELEGADLALLKDLMERRLRELGPEIHHTFSGDYRSRLREERACLESLWQKLGFPALTGTPEAVVAKSA